MLEKLYTPHQELLGKHGRTGDKLLLLLLLLFVCLFVCLLIYGISSMLKVAGSSPSEIRFLPTPKTLLFPD